MKTLLTIIGIIVLSVLSSVAVYRYAPLSFLEGAQKPTFGTTVTSIAGTDSISGSRTTINTNFTNLNNGKEDISDLIATTSLPAITTLAGLTTAGALTTVGALSSGSITTGFGIIPVAEGGTGSSTLAAFHILMGSSTNAVDIVQGLGTSGQFLTSQGAGLPPHWASASVDQTQNYTWTGLHIFSGGFVVNNSSSTISGSLFVTASTTLTGCNGCLSNYSRATQTFSLPTTGGTMSGATTTCPAHQRVLGGGIHGIPLSAAGLTSAYLIGDDYPATDNEWVVNVMCEQSAGGCAGGTGTVYAVCSDN